MDIDIDIYIGIYKHMYTHLVNFEEPRTIFIYKYIHKYMYIYAFICTHIFTNVRIRTSWIFSSQELLARRSSC